VATILTILQKSN